MKREGKACETRGLQEEGMADKETGHSKPQAFSVPLYILVTEQLLNGS